MSMFNDPGTGPNPGSSNENESEETSSESAGPGPESPRAAPVGDEEISLDDEGFAVLSTHEERLLVLNPLVQRIVNAPEEAARDAEEWGLMGPKLLEELKYSLESLQEAAEERGLPAPNMLEEGTGLARAIVGDIFGKRMEAAGYDPRAHPIDKINFLFSEENKCFFGRDCQNISLAEWLYEHYSDLLQRGLEMTVHPANPAAGEVRTDFITAARHPHERMALDNLLGRNIPVLRLAYEGKVKEIPIVLMWHMADEIKPVGLYHFTEDEIHGGTFNEWIGICSLDTIQGKDISVVEAVSCVVHEIDHAVFNLVHDSGIRKLHRNRRKLDDAWMAAVKNGLTEARERLRLEVDMIDQLIFEKRFGRRYGHSISLQGLGEVSENDFVKSQLWGAANPGGDEAGANMKLYSGLRILQLENVVARQLDPSFVIYSVGHVIARYMFKYAGGMDRIYMTDLLDRIVSHDSDVFVAMAASLFASREYMREGRNAFSSQPLPLLSPAELRRGIQKGLGPGVIPFLIGDVLMGIFEEAEAEVAGLSDERISAELDQLRGSSPDRDMLIESQRTERGDRHVFWTYVTLERQAAAISDIMDRIVPGSAD